MITLFIIHLVLFFVTLWYFIKKEWIYDITIPKDTLNIIGLVWGCLVSILYIICFIIQYLP
jgi:hypothetical protein